jgi:hypothetical protein
MQFFHPPVTSHLLGLNILLSNLFLNTVYVPVSGTKFRTHTEPIFFFPQVTYKQNCVLFPEDRLQPTQRLVTGCNHFSPFLGLFWPQSTYYETVVTEARRGCIVRRRSPIDGRKLVSVRSVHSDTLSHGCGPLATRKPLKADPYVE